MPGFIFVSILFCAVSALSGTVPWFLKEATNSFTQKGIESNRFYLFVIGYAVCWTMVQVLSNIKGIFSAWILSACDATINRVLLTKIMELPYQEQAKINAGKISSIVNRAVSAFSAITVSIFWTLVPIILQFIVALIALAKNTNLLFILTFVLSIAILTTISVYVAYQSRALHSSLYKASTERDGYTVERLRLLYDIRLNNAYEKERALIKIHLDKVVHIIRMTNLKMGIRHGFTALATGVALGAFTTLSVLSHKNNGFSAGDFVMISGYIAMLSSQLQFVCGALIGLERQKVALDDGIKYLEQKSEVSPNSRNYAVDSETVFDISNACIEKGGKLLINTLNFKFKKNCLTLIKGESGRGKTILMNAMLGLEPLKSGRILLNGVDVSIADNYEIIDRIAVAPQTANVISGTLRDNLCYGVKEHIPEDKFLIEVLNILNFNGNTSTRLIDLETRFDVQGDGLSGGERQRIAIGRAIVRRKGIMFLDEPTASLDIENAKRLITYLKNNIPTLIVISHDSKIEELADDVLVLN